MTDRELLDRKGHEVNDDLPPLPEPSKGFGLDAAIEHLQRHPGSEDVNSKRRMQRDHNGATGRI